MGTSIYVRLAAPFIATACGLLSAKGAFATTYLGNGGTGFGGDIGKGNLVITSTTVTDMVTGLPDPAVRFVLNSYTGTLDNNNLVLYIATGTPGLSDTRTLVDDGDNGGTASTIDNGREAISGYNDGSPAQGNPQPGTSRSVIAFPTGFAATYAISFAGAYDGMFMLPQTAGNGGLTYVDGSGSAYPLTLTLPLTDFGLTPGQSFSFVGTLIDGSSAYRSDEAIGSAVLNPDPTSGNPGTDLSTSGNPGFNNLIQFTSSDTFTTAAVPEPASLGLITLSGIVALRRRRVAAGV